MRVLLVLLSAFVVSSCSTMRGLQFQPNPTPIKIPAEAFTCQAPPGAWSVDADDVEIAINETKRTMAGDNCRQQVYTLCLVYKANDQVEGECIRPSVVPSPVD